MPFNKPIKRLERSDPGFLVYNDGIPLIISLNNKFTGCLIRVDHGVTTLLQFFCNR